MPTKPTELLPEVAKAFVEHMCPGSVTVAVVAIGAPMP
jgi:hypothetical protein